VGLVGFVVEDPLLDAGQVFEGAKLADGRVKVVADGLEFGLQLEHAFLEIIQGLVVIVQHKGFAEHGLSNIFADRLAGGLPLKGFESLAFFFVHANR